MSFSPTNSLIHSFVNDAVSPSRVCGFLRFFRALNYCARLLLAVLLWVGLSACSTRSGLQEPLLLQVSSLDEAFRIDIKTLDVVYNIDPDAEYAEGRSVMSFHMRQGQTRPVFHFDPWTPLGQGRENGLERVLLDGVEIPVEELQEVTFSGSDARVFEINRELVSGEHSLEFEWTLWNWFLDNEPGSFRTMVDDSSGMGNEILWPTINSPEELAHHTLEFRIHSAEPYAAVGSAGVQESLEDGVQIFKVDTGREVSSYTVMLSALPREQLSEHRFTVGDVRVNMLSTLDEGKTSQAMDVAAAQLYLLEASFGALAQPTVDILLIDWDTGVEYFAATTTGLEALSHELTHLYWGTAAVNATWRDSWLDEAINVWWNYDSAPVAEGFRSDLLSSRHTLELGFDGRAYEEGARVLGSVAAEIGSDNMVVFLRELYHKRLFAPYTTAEFVADLVGFTGDNAWLERFDRWVGKPQWEASPL